MRTLLIASIWLLILVCAVPSLAATNETLSQLIAKGDGTVVVSPDRVKIELGVETRNASSDVAAAQNAELMNRTMKALLATGLKSEDIQNRLYSLEIPSEDVLLRALSKEEKPPEYVATSSVTIELNATEDVGKLIEAAVAAGSNKIGAIRFYLSDPGPEESKALAKAITNARKKAEMMALSAGVKLGRLLEISEGYSRSYAAEAAAPAAGESQIQIKPRMIDVTADVTMTYEIMPSS
jgi:uncharacterized protein YggE